METFPIAGQIINTKLIFGLTARDIGEALVLPFLGLGIAQSLGASGDLFLIATGIALAFGVLILLITPAAQRPLSYARACAHYYFGTTSYRNRRTRPATETTNIRYVVGVRQAGLDIETIEAEDDHDSHQ
jgi:cell division protein FtsW (lipid II flippase)